MNATPPLLPESYGQLIGALLVLFLASTLYAIVLEFAENRWGFVTDYTWLCAILGCALAIAGIALVDWKAAALAAAAFAVSAPPIVVRSLIRDMRRRNELRHHLEERGNDGPPKTMA